MLIVMKLRTEATLVFKIKKKHLKTMKEKALNFSFCIFGQHYTFTLTAANTVEKKGRTL